MNMLQQIWQVTKMNKIKNEFIMGVRKILVELLKKDSVVRPHKKRREIHRKSDKGREI